MAGIWYTVAREPPMWILLVGHGLGSDKRRVVPTVAWKLAV